MCKLSMIQTMTDVIIKLQPYLEPALLFVKIAFSISTPDHNITYLHYLHMVLFAFCIDRGSIKFKFIYII